MVGRKKTVNVDQCSEWKEDKNRNPMTRRPIQSHAKIYKSYERQCLCKDWLLNKTVNPKTNRKIMVESRIYQRLRNKCSARLPPVMNRAQSRMNKVEVIDMTNDYKMALHLKPLSRSKSRSKLPNRKSDAKSYNRRQLAMLALTRVLRVLQFSIKSTTKKDKQFYADESGNMLFLSTLISLMPNATPAMTSLVKKMVEVWLSDPQGDPCTLRFVLDRQEQKPADLKKRLDDACDAVITPGWNQLSSSVQNNEKKQKRLPWNKATIAITLQYIRQSNTPITTGIAYCRQHWTALSKPLTFTIKNKNHHLSDESSYRVYLVTHLVFCGSGYGSDKAISKELKEFSQVLALISRWIVEINSTGHNAILMNFEELIELLSSALILSGRNGKQNLTPPVQQIVDRMDDYFMSRATDVLSKTKYARPGKFPNLFLDKSPSSWRHPLHVDYHSSAVVAMFLLLL